MLISKQLLLSILKEHFWDKSLSAVIEEFKQKLEDKLCVHFLSYKVNLLNLKSVLERIRRDYIASQKNGGRQLKQFKTKLSKQFYNWEASVDRHYMIAQIEQITSEKAELEKKTTQLENSVAVLSQENDGMKKILTENHQELKQGVGEINSLSKSQSFKRKRPLGDYTPSHRSKIKKLEAEQCRKSLSFLENFNCRAVSVNVERINGDSESISLTEKKHSNSELSDEEKEKLNMLVYIVDVFNISRKAYHEISMLYKSLPRSYTLCQYISQLNSKYEISDTPDTLGVQQSLRKKIDDVVSQISPEILGSVLKIKLSGDGTRVGKHQNFVNFTFTLLNESRCKSASGNYPLVIVKTQERYEEIKVALADLQREVHELQNSEMQIGSRLYTLRIYLGGDYKFLLMANGISSIQAEFNCIYCRCSRKERGNISLTWSMNNPEKGARVTHPDFQQLKLHKKSKTQYYSMVNEPLFPDIPLQDVVIDVLHMFLRVTDKLLSLLLSELQTMDNVRKCSSKSGFDKRNLKHIQMFKNILQQLGIKFEFYINKQSELQYSDLQGPEKELLLKKLDVKDLGLSTERSDNIQNLWNLFRKINDGLKSDNPDPENFQKLVDQWCEAYTNVYQSKDITPYIHILRCHTAELMQRHGAISFFTQQGLEKSNDEITKQYFRGSNHKGNTALRQIMLKQNRLLELESFKREKANYEIRDTNEEKENILPSI